MNYTNTKCTWEKWKTRTLKNKPRKERTLTVETCRGLNRSSIDKIWSINYLSISETKTQGFSLKTMTKIQFFSWNNQEEDRELFGEKQKKYRKLTSVCAMIGREI